MCIYIYIYMYIYSRELVLTTVIMALARLEPRAGAALHDPISEGWNSRSVLWAWKSNGFGIKIHMYIHIYISFCFVVLTFNAELS